LNILLSLVVELLVLLMAAAVAQAALKLQLLFLRFQQITASPLAQAAQQLLQALVVQVLYRVLFLFQQQAAAVALMQAVAQAA
jgi:hypothetical protein